MKPTVGRIVHYRNGGAPLAAIVTYVWPGESGKVNLAVFNVTGGLSCAAGVEPLDGPKNPSARVDGWEWPPREGGAAVGPLVLELKVDASEVRKAIADALDASNPRDGSDGEE